MTLAYDNATPLRAARLAARMRQGELADAVGISNSTLCFYELGREPRVRAALRLAAVLGVPVAELFPVDTVAHKR